MFINICKSLTFIPLRERSSIEQHILINWLFHDIFKCWSVVLHFKDSLIVVAPLIEISLRDKSSSFNEQLLNNILAIFSASASLKWFLDMSSDCTVILLSITVTISSTFTPPNDDQFSFTRFGCPKIEQ